MKAAVVASLLLGLAFLTSLGRAAEPPLPKRDLTVELRQTEEGREGGGSYSAGSADTPQWEPQMVQVRNGEKALLRMNDAIPMQWTQSVSGQDPAFKPSGSSGNGNHVTINAASGVSNALAWFDAGQSISVQPKWPGGNKPAVVEIEVQRAAVDPRMGAELPKQTRNTVSTTLTVPLAEWVTIAATGRAPKAGVYSSESGLQVRRLLQIRVMAP
ncbi:MAG: hypothetical protein HXX19_14740 [Rhodoferax sp.]|nr:hypothetical protein [Rhodoferax sp.]